MFLSTRTLSVPPILDVVSFNDFIVQFNDRLAIFADEVFDQYTGFSAIGDSTTKEIKRTLVADAKRIRPLFTYFTYKLFGGVGDEAAIMRMCLAVEVLHDFALIHDDITDLSLMRRGEPTIEKVFRDIFEHKGSEASLHAGLNAAIYSGDILLMLANNLVATMDLKDGEVRNMLMDCWYTMQVEVLYGQKDDGFGIRNDSWDEINLDRILSILSLKSGRYTIQKPMLFGAILAGASRQQIATLSTIGENFGVIFQIKDDLLGVFGQEQMTGKSSVSDILEGKKTSIMYQTYQHSNEDSKKLINTIVGNRGATSLQVSQIRQLIEDTGIRAKTENECHEGVQLFKTSLANISGLNTKYLRLMSNLADFIVDRVK